ncbi:MAG: hypothetical protein JRI23_23730, partial [Deltaproteobacteria bacterium]|nr:hypothetical protein [Deltaproteobacteria bacterium]MBW2535004.1 hypothetical protein [Deltaproteobacteria bacterium]
MSCRAAPWLGILLLALSGCHLGRAMISTPGDYEDYRRIRLAPSFDERLTAAWYYVNARPDGRFADRVRAYFD